MTNIANFDNSVFVNCPFDDDYKPLMLVVLFTIVKCGFKPRIASERNDSDETRINKIKELIKHSKYSIHDLSRIEPLDESDLPRFNMPFELGLDLGARIFSHGTLSHKKCLILEKEKYRYQKVLSDISGNDIKSHNNDPETIVRHIRNWINEHCSSCLLSASKIWYKYNDFSALFDKVAKDEGYSKNDIDEMPVSEYIEFVERLSI